MYLRDALRVLVRRWYIVVPLFVVLAFGTNIMAKRTPYSYRSTATVVLLPPTVVSAADPTLANPYLSFSSNMASTAAILARASTTDSAADGLRTQGASATYTVHSDPHAPGAPVLLVAATSTHPEIASRTLDGVISLLRSELADRQQAAKAPANLFISLSVISSNSPERLDLARSKVLGGGLAVAVLFPVVIALLVEAFTHRGARAPGAASTGSTGGPPGGRAAGPAGARARPGAAAANGFARRGADGAAGMHDEHTMRVGDVEWTERGLRPVPAPAGGDDLHDEHTMRVGDEGWAERGLRRPGPAGDEVHDEHTMRVTDVDWAIRSARSAGEEDDVHDEHTQRVTDLGWVEDTVRVGRDTPRTYPDPGARRPRAGGAGPRSYPEPRTYPDPRTYPAPRGYQDAREPAGGNDREAAPGPGSGREEYAEHPTMGGGGISYPRPDADGRGYPDDDPDGAPAGRGGRRRR